MYGRAFTIYLYLSGDPATSAGHSTLGQHVMNFENLPWLDLVLVGLLCATLAYAYMLNQRLRYLRQNADKLATLTREFTEATDTANLATMNLKTAAASAADRLEAATKRAESVYSDLDFLLSRAEKAAFGLDSKAMLASSPVRQQTKPEPAPKPQTKARLKAPQQEISAVMDDEQNAQQGSMAANELLEVINAARKLQG